MIVHRLLFLLLGTASVVVADDVPNARRPADDGDLRYWLTNTIVDHRFSPVEVRDATGLSLDEIAAATKRLGIAAGERPRRGVGEPLRVLPYPGGRHPRIGFLEGAVEPQRETKVGVFTPWDTDPARADYVVVDVPEAIWSNLGLTYLAHTHVDTVWTKQGVELERLEWNRRRDGSLDVERRLPNGIVFGARVVPQAERVLMDLWLVNGTPETLTDLRVQNCVMLKSARGFDALTNENKVTRSPYTSCRSDDGGRWIVSAWTPIHRAWANAKCPCLHSDPRFPDAPPGETVRCRGVLGFFEGADVRTEFDRLEGTDWRTVGLLPEGTAAAAARVRQIVAHRGASAERPENTLASTRRAIEAGATAVEVDVRLTRDGRLMLLHDATLDRTTNGTGPLAESTFGDVRKLDAGSWFDARYADERVPTLEEALEVCKGRIDVLLDLKGSGEAYARQVAAAVREHGEPARTIVGVRSVEQARQFRALLPKSRQLGLIAKPEEIEAYAAAGVETIRLWPKWIEDASLPNRVRAAGARLHVNGTTGTPGEVVPLLAYEPDSTSSDDPGRLVETLRGLRTSQ
jgi:glycerophosphoryl diester phosphodiesterase